MSFTYTVQKRKYNRLSYRVIGIIFLVIVALQFIPLLKGYANHIALTILFSSLLGMYGIYLLWASFRKQAFDITYLFDENGMKVSHRYGETLYPYEDILFITMVIADESLIYYILNVKTKKEQFTIPFTNKGELCSRIYDFVNERIPHEDEE